MLLNGFYPFFRSTQFRSINPQTGYLFILHCAQLVWPFGPLRLSKLEHEVNSGSLVVHGEIVSGGCQHDNKFNLI